MPNYEFLGPYESDAGLPDGSVVRVTPNQIISYDGVGEVAASSYWVETTLPVTVAAVMTPPPPVVAPAAAPPEALPPTPPVEQTAVLPAEDAGDAVPDSPAPGLPIPPDAIPLSTT